MLSFWQDARGSLNWKLVGNKDIYDVHCNTEMLLDWLPDNVHSISPISFAIALTVLIITVIYYYSTNKNLPPGPIGLPFFGYWPFLNEKNVNSRLDSFKKKYGDFYSFTSTGYLYISLGSFKAVREAHVAKSEYFGGRFEDYNLLTTIFGDGMGFLNGEGWKVLRKFFLQVFKDRGMLSVKEHVSSSMYESINSTIEELKGKEKGEPVNILQLLTDKCTSILRLTLFGEEGVTEAQIREIDGFYGGIIECQTSTNLLLTGNVARYLILPLTPGYRKFKNSQVMIENILFKIINEHKLTYNKENIRDVIDEYIKERNERQRKGDPTAQYFTDRALVSTLVQIVGDGVVSVAAFIAVFIKIILDHPEEQDKIYQELVDVVGLDRLPTVEDKSKLVYMNAFLMESLRSIDFFPFFPSMQCTKETTIRGYRIPVGTITLLNMWSAHNDPEVYDEPERFNPSRFLEKEGNKRPEMPITFGVGKRACVGEGFVMLQAFLFLSSLVQNFRISLLNEKEKNTHELLFSGRLQIRFEPRS